MSAVAPSGTASDQPAYLPPHQQRRGGRHPREVPAAAVGVAVQVSRPAQLRRWRRRRSSRRSCARWWRRPWRVRRCSWPRIWPPRTCGWLRLPWCEPWPSRTEVGVISKASRAVSASLDSNVRSPSIQVATAARSVCTTALRAVLIALLDNLDTVLSRLSSSVSRSWVACWPRSASTS